MEERFQEEKGLPKSLSSINRAWLDKLALHDLDQDGFAVPSARDVAKTWAVGLEALPVYEDGPGLPAEMCTFVHFLNLVWQPVLSYFESLCKNETQKKSARVDRNETAVNMEMIGILDSPEDIILVEEWVEFIRKYILRLVAVDVPAKLINQVISPLCSCHCVLHTSQCNALLAFLLVLQAGGLGLG